MQTVNYAPARLLKMCLVDCSAEPTGSHWDGNMGKTRDKALKYIQT